MLAQQDFIITYDNSYLDNYEASKKRVHAQMQNIKRLVSDNPNQLQQTQLLSLLAERCLTSIDQSIKLSQENTGTSRDQQWLVSAVHINLQQARSVAANMVLHETQLLSLRKAGAETTTKRAKILVVCGYIISTIILILTFGFLIKETKRRIKNEETAKDYASEVADLYENAPCGYHSLDAKGYFKKINNTELSMLGYEREEVIDKLNFKDILSSESQNVFDQNFSKFKELGFIKDIEFELRRKNGSLFPVSLSATALFDEAGNFVLSRSTVFDIAQRKQSDEAIRQLNSDLETYTHRLENAYRELEGFSYSISHDLRAPLRAIDGFSHILEEDHASQLDNEGRRLLKVIRANSDRMGNLIDDLLTFSRLSTQPIKKSLINTSALIQECFKECNEHQRASLKLHFLPQSNGDYSLLRQVWINLISNAIKFSATKPASQLEIGSYEDNGNDIYYIKDNGVGFDMQYYDKLFGIFQRLHANAEFAGTGVGLAIVNRIVVRHGGKVWAESEFSNGATFYFSLPK